MCRFQHPKNDQERTHIGRNWQKKVVLPHFRQRADESLRQDENFGTFGLFLSFFVFEIWPFNVELPVWEIFSLYFSFCSIELIRTRNTWSLTAVSYYTLQVHLMGLAFSNSGEGALFCLALVGCGAVVLIICLQCVVLWKVQVL